MGCTPARSATAMGDGAAEVRAALATDMGVVWLKVWVWLAEGVTPSGVPLTLRGKKDARQQTIKQTQLGGGGQAAQLGAGDMLAGVPLAMKARAVCGALPPRRHQKPCKGQGRRQPLGERRKDGGRAALTPRMGRVWVPG